MNRGLAATIAAFGLWGLVPLYWKQLAAVPATEIMAHRLIWCLVFVWIWLALRERGSWWRPLLADRRTRYGLLASGALIGGNWWLYIWSVNNNHVVEASLGYFINPLVNIALGTLLLKEQLNRWQWLSIALAAVGVAWLTVDYGRPPWIALTLAFSFGAYGLLRKTSAVGSVQGLGLETALLFPVALATIAMIGWQGELQFGRVSPLENSLLILGGAVTAIPLILFAYGARLIPYSTVGIVQYLGPTLQLLIGVGIYHEPFGSQRMIGFSIIWVALAIYAANGLLRLRRDRQQRRRLLMAGPVAAAPAAPLADIGEPPSRRPD
ncbi:MAG: EamA family transporter RarD [Oceanococcaceae bacterium]